MAGRKTMEKWVLFQTINFLSYHPTNTKKGWHISHGGFSNEVFLDGNFTYKSLSIQCSSHETWYIDALIPMIRVENFVGLSSLRSLFCVALRLSLFVCEVNGNLRDGETQTRRETFFTSLSGVSFRRFFSALALVSFLYQADFEIIFRCRGESLKVTSLRRVSSGVESDKSAGRDKLIYSRLFVLETFTEVKQTQEFGKSLILLAFLHKLIPRGEHDGAFLSLVLSSIFFDFRNFPLGNSVMFDKILCSKFQLPKLSIIRHKHKYQRNMKFIFSKTFFCLILIPRFSSFAAIQHLISNNKNNFSSLPHHFILNNIAKALLFVDWGVGECESINITPARSFSRGSSGRTEIVD